MADAIRPHVLENTQEVTLTKSSGGLGFSFLMCELDPPMRDFGTLVRIKKLFPGQPAHQSGRIQEGDVLLAINGRSLKKLTYPVCLQEKEKRKKEQPIINNYIYLQYLLKKKTKDFNFKFQIKQKIFGAGASLGRNLSDLVEVSVELQ